MNSNSPTSQTNSMGRLLYRLLPEVYRTRDGSAVASQGPGDLAQLLEACGGLLDRIHGTLHQQLLDTSPESCQPWLIPYFADLLDIRLVSPDLAGQRQEVARGMEWRKSKGTLRCIDEIAQVVSQSEVEVREGWRRVAVTPRVDAPLLPAAAFGVDEPDAHVPADLATHPGLPAVTPDLRRHSRAKAALASPVLHETRYPGNHNLVGWVQQAPHGAPCFPGSYEDASRRTPDLRTPAWDRGQVHPRRILLYVPLPAGFFAPGHVSLVWNLAWIEAAGPGDVQDEIFLSDKGQIVARTWLVRQRVGETDQNVLEIRREILTRTDGGVETVWQFTGVGDTPPALIGDLKLPAQGPGANENRRFRLVNLALLDDIEVAKGVLTLELERVAVRHLVSHQVGVKSPVLLAKDCLFQSIRVARGAAQIEYSTVLGRAIAETLWASDSLFCGEISKDVVKRRPPLVGCLRYCAIPETQAIGGMRLYPPSPSTRSSAIPVFNAERWGAPGCAVLHPATSVAITRGAEDGSEIGAYHHRHFCQRLSATIDKLGEYLPLGLSAIVIPDGRMLSPPPR